jgi:hypothetical protein
MDSNLPNNIDPYLQQNNFHRDSWKDMVQNFYTDITRLMDKESQLIRTEMNEKVTQIKVATSALITSGVILFVGVLCAAATAIVVLDMFTERWIASGIVTVVLLAVGGIMFAGAKKKLNASDLKPTKSIEAFGEIRQTLQEKVNEITKH